MSKYSEGTYLQMGDLKQMSFLPFLGEGHTYFSSPFRAHSWQGWRYKASVLSHWTIALTPKKNFLVKYCKISKLLINLLYGLMDTLFIILCYNEFTHRMAIESPRFLSVEFTGVLTMNFVSPFDRVSVIKWTFCNCSTTRCNNFGCRTIIKE